MAKNHYDTLGVKQNASSEDIRSAYRALVKEHHPDRSKNPKSTAIFIAVTEAYEVIGDGDRRKSYDEVLRLEKIRDEQRRLRLYAEQQKRGGGLEEKYSSKVNTPAAPKTPPAAAKAHVSATAEVPVTIEVTRLTLQFSRGMHGEAEKMARKIIQRDPRQPIPYAVLGDLARQRGKLPEALKMYAYAVQMDPGNKMYQDRYEELLGAVDLKTQRQLAPGSTTQLLAPVFGFGVTLLGALYIIISGNGLAPAYGVNVGRVVGICTWLFVCGVFVGGSLSLGGLVDRFSSTTKTATGKLGTGIALATVAIVDFWAATVLYIAMGLVQRSFNFSLSRVIGSVAIVASTLAFAASFGGDGLGVPVFLFGGNLTYIGALCGWMVCDSLQR